MPWNERNLVSLRSEFVHLAQSSDFPFVHLCRRFGISAKTGYKWLDRHRAGTGLEDRSRRPLTSPNRIASSVEAAIVEIRHAHPSWGGRKISRRLLDTGVVDIAPAPSTVTTVLHRHDLIDESESRRRQPWIRFERSSPNELWQMDFKGHFAVETGRCHPLTVLDDHSRYCVGLRSCPNETTSTVMAQLCMIFRLHGLPLQINVDNGSPWGCEGRQAYTQLVVWLIDLGITVTYSRPYHPQTNGKDERFHRTLKADAIGTNRFTSIQHSQEAFDKFRHVYNHERPHDSLGLDVPASRYHPSHREYCESIASAEYGDGDIVRTVVGGGRIKFNSSVYRIGKAFTGRRVALRPTNVDGVWDIHYRHQHIRTIDEKDI